MRYKNEKFHAKFDDEEIIVCENSAREDVRSMIKGLFAPRQLPIEAFWKGRMNSDQYLLCYFPSSLHYFPADKLLCVPPKSNGGMVVNKLFEAVNGVHTPGDLAPYIDPALGRRRMGSYDHSIKSGLCQVNGL